MLILIVAAGPDKGRLYELDGQTPVVIGREGAEIRLNDTKVSRRHTRLWCEGGRWYAQDFNSRSGTHRNDTLIEGKHPLQDGDRLRVGGTLLVVTRKLSNTTAQPDTTQPADQAARDQAIAELSSIPSARSARPRTFAWAAGGAAATVLIGLNLASLLTQQRAVRELDTGLNQTRTALITGVAELRGFVSNTPQLNEAVGRLADDTAHGLNAATAALAQQAARDADLSRSVETLRATQARRDTDLAQLAGAITGVDQKLNGLSNLEGLNDAARLATEVTSLRRTLTDPDVRRAGLQPIETRLDALVAKMDPAAVSVALAPKLDALVQRLDTQPSGTAIALRVDESLTRLANELSTRPDTELIREQLAAALNQRDTDRAAQAADDPILGQVLAELQTLQQTHQRLENQLTTLQSAPFDNQAMLSEALALLGRHDQATRTAVAQQLDLAMAELRGKSITDADQLRRLINREVVAAVDQNLRHSVADNRGPQGRSPARRDRGERLTRTEAAYRLAFESGQKVAIGTRVSGSVTGTSAPGRTLDPADARARGLSNWRDWYLMDDLAARKKAHDAAEALVRQNRSRGTGVLQLPGAANITVNASPAAE